MMDDNNTHMSSELSEQLVEEFFRAPMQAASTHEEWLLRMCAQLMHREAHVVSFMEQQQKAGATGKGGGRGRGWTRRGSRSSAPSTKPSGETQYESSSES